MAIEVTLVSALQTVIWLRRRRHDSGGFWLGVRRRVAWPLQKLGALAHVVMSKALLLSCEVALEYMLALTYAPQARCLQSLQSNVILMPRRQDLLHMLAPGAVWGHPAGYAGWLLPLFCIGFAVLHCDGLGCLLCLMFTWLSGMLPASIA